MSVSSQFQYANSTVPCSVFVVPDSTHINSVKAAVGGAVLPAGISQNSARTRPDPDFSQSTQAQQIAAIAGEELTVWVDTARSVDLVCNYAWNPGDLITSDASGYGVTASVGQYYGARALGSGTVGAICPVDVVFGYKGA